MCLPSDFSPQACMRCKIRKHAADDRYVRNQGKDQPLDCLQHIPVSGFLPQQQWSVKIEGRVDIWKKLLVQYLAANTLAVFAPRGPDTEPWDVSRAFNCSSHWNLHLQRAFKRHFWISDMWKYPELDFFFPSLSILGNTITHFCNCGKWLCF